MSNFRIRLIGITILLGVSLLCFSCASLGPVYQKIDSIPEGVGLVYIYRPFNLIGSGVVYDVKVGETAVTTLSIGGYYPYFAKPGEVELWAKTESKSSVTLDVKAGQTYFVKGTVGVGILVGRPHLMVVPTEIGEKEIVECNLIPEKKNEGLVISLAPYSEQSSGVVRTGEPLEIEVKNISDLRVDKLRLGERTAAFSVKMGDIYPNRKADEYMTEALSDALRKMGHRVGSSANGVTVQGELHKLWVETPATMLYWDITAEIELKLLVKGPAQESGTTHTYTSKKKERTYGYPSASLIEKAVSTAVADIMNQVQSDKIWNILSSNNKPGG